MAVVFELVSDSELPTRDVTVPTKCVATGGAAFEESTSTMLTFELFLSGFSFLELEPKEPAFGCGLALAFFASQHT